jgi:hypothetical protein
MVTALVVGFIMTSSSTGGPNTEPPGGEMHQRSWRCREPVGDVCNVLVLCTK